MAQATDIPPVLSPDDEIQFVGSHRPGLQDGHYRVELQQQVKIDTIS